MQKLVNSTQPSKYSAVCAWDFTVLKVQRKTFNSRSGHPATANIFTHALAHAPAAREASVLRDRERTRTSTTIISTIATEKTKSILAAAAAAAAATKIRESISRRQHQQFRSQTSQIKPPNWSDFLNICETPLNGLWGK